MDLLLHDIIPWVLRHGPLIIFLVVAAETAFFLGLLMPAEATVLLGGFLVSRGYFELDAVLLATCGGAFVGDQAGYLLGRRYGGRVSLGKGKLGRLWRRYEARATMLFRRRSMLAVTVARFVSFLRTLMPWFAGMTRLDYRRFLAYDLVGVIGWGAGSVALGYMAGASWRLVAGTVGTVSSIVLLLLLLGLLVAGLRQRRIARQIERALTGDDAGFASPSPDPR